MLKRIKQTDENLIKDIQEDGCLFLDFAEVSPLIFESVTGCWALNYLWEKAKEKKIIDKDNVVQDHTALAHLFHIKAHYDGTHHDAKEIIPSDVLFVFGLFKYKYTHFVVINKSKEVIFDSLGVSNTVKNGKLVSMRYYYAD